MVKLLLHLPAIQTVTQVLLRSVQQKVQATTELLVMNEADLILELKRDRLQIASNHVSLRNHARGPISNLTVSIT